LLITFFQIKEAAFDQLRTKEQLGYIVFSSVKRIAQNILALSIIVQSSHKDPMFLDSRIEDFLLNYRETLVSMTNEKLQIFVQALVEKLLEKPKNLDQVCLYFIAGYMSEFDCFCSFSTANR
jgi:insulysin